MDVKPAGTISVNDLFSKVRDDSRTHEKNSQGWTTESDRADTEKKAWSEKGLTEKLDSLNKLSELQMTSVQFEKHEALDRMFVKVVDRDTKEVVKEIPPEEFLDMISSMLEFAGIIIDEKI
ncbi:flagellar protein FlaG [Alteribacter populi]|uniref:flagellar protein FlaG n=1 Tax=Alteribacter populi TaxID=2011011 RepID=UPI000BBAD22C|nr:flagellar protein FlaG [Alteribacter populi]